MRLVPGTERTLLPSWHSQASRLTSLSHSGRAAQTFATSPSRALGSLSFGFPAAPSASHSLDADINNVPEARRDGMGYPAAPTCGGKGLASRHRVNTALLHARHSPSAHSYKFSAP